MSRFFGRAIGAAIVTLASCLSVAQAGVQLSILGYNIQDGVVRNNSPDYSGTVTVGSSFTNFASQGRIADFTGWGSGVLNDGVVGGPALTQFFIGASASDGTVFCPSVELKLDGVCSIEGLSLFGGMLQSGIPGALTRVTVSMVDAASNVFTETFNLAPFGPDNKAGVQSNDWISFIGSSLEGIAATQILLTGFEGSSHNWFSISEIEVFADNCCPPAAVPEAGTLAVWSLGGCAAAAVGLGRRRRNA